MSSYIKINKPSELTEGDRAIVRTKGEPLIGTIKGSYEEGCIIVECEDGPYMIYHESESGFLENVLGIIIHEEPKHENNLTVEAIEKIMEVAGRNQYESWNNITVEDNNEWEGSPVNDGHLLFGKIEDEYYVKDYSDMQYDEPKIYMWKEGNGTLAALNEMMGEVQDCIIFTDMRNKEGVDEEIEDIKHRDEMPESMETVINKFKPGNKLIAEEIADKVEDEVIEIEYKYGELDVLEKLRDHIDNTYNQHYSKGKVQTTEFILDSGHGVGFCIGNIIKYAQRYGKKGGNNIEDLYKMGHYMAILIGHETKRAEEEVEAVLANDKHYPYESIEEDINEYPEDILVIKVAMELYSGVEASDKEAARLWRRYSSDMAAGWMIIPKSKEGLMEIITNWYDI